MTRPIVTLSGLVAACLLTACGGNNDSATTTDSTSMKTPTTSGANLPDAAQFKDSLDGQATGLFILRNKNQAAVAITNYGARVVCFVVPDKFGT